MSSRTARMLSTSMSNRVVSNTSTKAMRMAPMHPASQKVLKHLQSSWSDWTKAKGLDRGLRINEDGTFNLDFPKHGWRIWTSHDRDLQQHWLNVDTVQVFSRYKVSDTPRIPLRDWAECTLFEKKLRKRSIPVLYEREKIPESEVAGKVDEMIMRLTRWGT